MNKLNDVIPGYTYSGRDYINCMTCKHRIRSVSPTVMTAWYDDLDCLLVKDKGPNFRIELDHICNKYEELQF